MIGVIADDLSGAAEIGAVGLRYGLDAEIVACGDKCGRSGLVCVDTDSRSCTATEAARHGHLALSFNQPPVKPARCRPVRM